METSSSCKKELVGEYIGDGEKHTCSFSHEGEESEGLSLIGGERERGRGEKREGESGGEEKMRRREEEQKEVEVENRTQLRKFIKSIRKSTIRLSAF